MIEGYKYVHRQIRPPPSIASMRMGSPNARQEPTGQIRLYQSGGRCGHGAPAAQTGEQRRTAKRSRGRWLLGIVYDLQVRCFSRSQQCSGWGATSLFNAGPANFSGLQTCIDAAVAAATYGQESYSQDWPRRDTDRGLPECNVRVEAGRGLAKPLLGHECPFNYVVAALANVRRHEEAAAVEQLARIRQHGRTAADHGSIVCGI